MNISRLNLSLSTAVKAMVPNVQKSISNAVMEQDTFFYRSLFLGINSQTLEKAVTLTSLFTDQQLSVSTNDILSRQQTASIKLLQVHSETDFCKCI